MSAQLVILAFPALLFEPVVESIPRRKGRDRHHEVAPGVSDQALNRSFVIALAGAPISIPDHVVRQHLAEQLRAPACPVRFDPGHQAAVVVVEDRQRHGTEEREGVDMPIHPGFRCRRRICTDVAGIAVRQIKREEVSLLLDAADHHGGFAKVGLGMAWRVRERNEHLAMPPAMFAHVVLDDCIAAGKPVLVTEPLENTFGRMSLLARALPILEKPSIDDHGEAFQLRPPDRHRTPVARRHRKRHHLPHAVPRYPEMTSRLALAHAFGTRQANLAIQIHGEDPPALPPSKRRAKVDDFYAARSRLIPPLPWSTFAPPFSCNAGHGPATRLDFKFPCRRFA